MHNIPTAFAMPYYCYCTYAFAARTSYHSLGPRGVALPTGVSRGAASCSDVTCLARLVPRDQHADPEHLPSSQFWCRFASLVAVVLTRAVHRDSYVNLEHFVNLSAGLLRRSSRSKPAIFFTGYGYSSLKGGRFSYSPSVVAKVSRPNILLFTALPHWFFAGLSSHLHVHTNGYVLVDTGVIFCGVQCGTIDMVSAIRPQTSSPHLKIASV